MKEKLGFYRPAVAAFLAMMAMAVTSSTLSFFLEPVCAQLNIGKGSFSLIFSLMTISGAATNPILGRRAGKKGVRGILAVAAIWGCGSLLLFSMAQRLWMLYLAGFLLGLFGSNCLALCGNVIVQNAYDPRQASGILGVVMSGSGVGGMIFNLIIPSVLAAAGWQRAMAVMAFCWLAVVGASVLMLGKEKTMAQLSGGAGVGLGMTQAEAMKSPKLYMLIAVIVVITAACGVQQQQPSMLGLYGYDSGKISRMISVQTAVLAAGKIGQGILYGRLGVRRGGCTMLLVFGSAFLILAVPALAWPGLMVMALGLGVYTTLLPLVTRQVFGTREYAAIWGMLATCGSVGTIVANPVWGSICDLTGSYTIAMLVLPVLLTAAAWILNKLLKDLR